MRSVADIVRSIRGHMPMGFARPAAGGFMDAILSSVAGEIETAEDAAAAMMDEIDPRTATYCLADFERVLGPDPAGRDLEVSNIDDRRKLAHQRWTAKGGQSIPYFLKIGTDLGLDISITEFWPSLAGAVYPASYDPVVTAFAEWPESEVVLDVLATTWSLASAEVEEWPEDEDARFAGVAAPTRFVRPDNAGVFLQAGRRLFADGEQFTWVIGMPAVTVTPFRAGLSRAGQSLAAFSASNAIETYLQLIKPAHTRLIFEYSGA